MHVFALMNMEPKKERISVLIVEGNIKLKISCGYGL
jgi:hypothetical protein